MKSILKIFPALLLLLYSCSTPNSFIVSELGYGPLEFEENIIYTLPKTVFHISVSYEKEVFVPGPYADYAQKLLGITDVQKKRKEMHAIRSIQIVPVQEMDDNFMFALNVVEGDFDRSILEKAEQRGLIMMSDLSGRISARKMDLYNEMDDQYFTDLGMEPNVELKTETIYKTILTDTSFMSVPVTSEQLARKTLEQKAEEAANLILELRTDRYYSSAGLLDPYPQDFDLGKSLERLDELEKEYLSLFIGKRYSERYSKEYIVFPKGDPEGEIITFEYFSEKNGLESDDARGLSLRIIPSEKAQSLRNLMPQLPEEGVYNRLYYRIPLLCDITVEYGGEILLQERSSLFQAGAMINQKIQE